MHQIRFPLGLYKPSVGSEEKERGRGGEGKVKGRKGQRRWREGFDPPNNFGVESPMDADEANRPLK